MLTYIIKSKSSGGITKHITQLEGGANSLGNTVKVFEVRFHPLNLFRDLRIIKKTLANDNPDIIHFHGYKALLLTHLMPRNVVKVCTIHGFLENRKLLTSALIKRAAVYSAKGVDRFICVSNSLKDYFSKEFNVSLKKITVIHNGVETTKDIAIRRQKPQVIGVCGRLVDIKGYQHLIQAFNSIHHHFGIELHIIGDGPYRDKLQKLADECVPHKIHFYGHKEKPIDYIKKFDIFVQPSLLEGCGVASLEAMELNLPVISSNAGGLSELVKHGVNGLVFPKGDVEALTKCLFMVLSNSELYRKLGDGNKKWVSNTFSSTKMLELTIKTYKELMGDQRNEKVI